MPSFAVLEAAFSPHAVGWAGEQLDPPQQHAVAQKFMASRQTANNFKVGPPSAGTHFITWLVYGVRTFFVAGPAGAPKAKDWPSPDLGDMQTRLILDPGYVSIASTSLNPALGPLSIAEAGKTGSTPGFFVHLENAGNLKAEGRKSGRISTSYPRKPVQSSAGVTSS